MKSLKLSLLVMMALLIASGTALAAQHTVGLGVASAPDYEGSDDSQGLPLLMFTGKYDSGRSFTLKGTNLKVNLLANERFSFGPALNYRMERDDVDNDQVDAMKDIDAALEAGVFGSIRVNNWLFGLEVLNDVSDEHDGMIVQATAAYRWKLSDELVLTPGASVTYADDDYMDTYFGVNSKNRGASTLPDFKAESDLKDVGASLVAHYTPWEHWGVMGILSYTALLNDAKDSPIVDDEGDDKQVFLGLMATYRWGSM